VKSQWRKRILSCANSGIGAAAIILTFCLFSCGSDTETQAPGEKEQADTGTADKTAAQLKDFEVNNFEELTGRYPLGWAYLVIDPKTKEIVSKGRTGLSDDFQIDWSIALVHEITAERLILQLPDISYKSKENRTGSQMVNFPRGPGISPRVKFSPEGLDMWVQMLADGEGRPVALMGFREQQPPAEEK
jgi:hypothetical protein